MLKRIMIGLIVVSVALIVASGASAKVCVFKVGGTCVFWSGSVIADITANGLGNVQKDPKAVTFTVDAKPTPEMQSALMEEEDPPLTGWVFCGNPGKNKHAAPGRQPADFYGDYPSGYSYITKKDIDQNGVSNTVVQAKLDVDGLASLTPICAARNNQWTAIDFVPFSFFTVVDLVEVDDYGDIVSYIDDAAFYCELPNPDLVVWDKNANAPTQEQYQCDRLY